MRSETVEIELFNYDSFNEFAWNVNYKKHLQNYTKYIYGIDGHEVKQMEPKDFGVVETNDSFTLNENTWRCVEYYDLFGIKHVEYVNDDIYADLPWTIWVQERYSYGKWCGQIFMTEKEAEDWLQTKLENEKIADEEG